MRLILRRLAPEGRLIAFDKDPGRWPRRRAFQDAFAVRHQGFAALAEWPPRSVTGVLMDLGISSPQIDNPHGVFLFVPTARWTCAWTPRAGRRAHWLARADGGRLRR